MEIRPAKIHELEMIESIYSSAREFMRLSGNPDQWRDSYPGRPLITDDINSGRLFICEDEGEALAVFYYAIGDDPTYSVIEDGDWIYPGPYGVIHRIAVSASARGRGISSRCFDFALARCGNLKIDTHKSNIPMQRALEKCGFSRCGIIHLENGEERVAFQRVLEP